MNIKNIILGVIIAVVFLLFSVYGTKLLYKAPNYNDYCNQNKYLTPIPTDKPTYNDTYYQQQQTYFQDCQNNWNKANEAYSKNLFIISLVFSVIIIAIASFLISVDAVSGGLMLGSLMFLIYGTGNYWQYMNDWLRFIILGIALLILIYIGYRLARREKK